MKKLLIASSVMAALSMVNVANADPSTTNGGTIEFLGEITDSTCPVTVDGATESGSIYTPGYSGNMVMLPTVASTAFVPGQGTAGRTQFFLRVANDGAGTQCSVGKVEQRAPNGTPTGTVVDVTKVSAFFNSSVTASDLDRFAVDSATAGAKYNTGNFNNVDQTTGYLNNIIAAAKTTSMDDGGAGSQRDLRTFVNAATGVKLRLLDGTTNKVIKVGDASQQNTNTYYALDLGPTGTPTPSKGKTLMPYYVEYVADNIAAPNVTAGMVRGFVVYDLMYK